MFIGKNTMFIGKNTMFIGKKYHVYRKNTKFIHEKKSVKSNSKVVIQDISW